MSDAGTGYELGADGLSYTVVDGRRRFNRGIRKGCTVLVTGDVPRFAVLRTLSRPMADPPFACLGDGSFAITVDGITHQLDEMRGVRTKYTPSETSWTADIASRAEVILTVGQAGDWGAVARLEVRNIGSTTLRCGLGVTYGDLGLLGRPVTEDYLAAPIAHRSKGGQPRNQSSHVRIESQVANFSANDLDYSIDVWSPSGWPSGAREGRAGWENAAELGPGATTALVLVARVVDEAAPIDFDLDVNPDALLASSRAYYASLIAAHVLRTPLPVLNAAFAAGITSLEYGHSGEAWLEGVHWWTAYWANNFQISAAISLGQADRARAALGFFGRQPSAVLQADGSPFDDGVMDQQDGLPYFLHQLLQYTDHTGDLAVVRGMWPDVVSAFNDLWHTRDLDGDGLIGWHRHCNAFLYQADHIGLPGAAASPSIMAVGLLERMANIADLLKEYETAEGWRARARDVRSALFDRLWVRDEGAFLSHLDDDGISHHARYYTDLVFPVLYADIPANYAWLGLEYLRQNLLLDARGRTLMRVGQFLPSLFGNDNVMPAQMAEAARAFLASGNADLGTALLLAVAQSATIDTDAPGAFPERLSDDGHGLPNYLFGNPAGSYVYSCIAGLVGVELQNGGRLVHWHPAFPDEWAHADLELPYLRVAFARSWQSGIMHSRYQVRAAAEIPLSLDVSLPIGEVLDVTSEGQPASWTVTPAIGRTKLHVKAGPARNYAIEVRSVASAVSESTCHVKIGQTLSWTAPGVIVSVEDPQAALDLVAINGRQLRAVAQSAGLRTVFVRTDSPPAIHPLRVSVEQNPPAVTVNDVRICFNGDLAARITVRARAGNPAAGIRLVSSLGGQGHVPYQSGDYDIRLELERAALPGPVDLHWYVQPEFGGVSAGAGTVRWNLTPSCQDREWSRRRRFCQALDLSSVLSDTAILVTSRWRHSRVTPDRAAFAPGGIASAGRRQFKVPSDGPSMALIEAGCTERGSVRQRHSGRPAALTVAVETNVDLVEILFANEVDSRHTGERVGRVVLSYADGTVQLEELIVGRTIETYWDHFASDLEPLTLEPPFPGEARDSLSVLVLPADGNRTLNSIEVAVEAADVRVGLMAVNVISGSFNGDAND